MLVCAAQTLDRTPINPSKSRENLTFLARCFIACRGQVDNLIFSDQGYYSMQPPINTSTNSSSAPEGPFMGRCPAGCRRGWVVSKPGCIRARRPSQSDLMLGMLVPQGSTGVQRPTGDPAVCVILYGFLCVKQPTTWITVLIMYKWSCPDKIRVVAPNAATSFSGIFQRTTNM